MDFEFPINKKNWRISPKIGKINQIHTRSLIFLIKKTQKNVRQKHN
jgi:hypothetical protein